MENYHAKPMKIEHMVETEPFDPIAHHYINVSKESSVQQLVKSGLSLIGPGKPIVWFGEGKSCSKVVTCAEMFKNKYKGAIHQVTKVRSIKTTEIWEPIMDGLDDLEVSRTVPILFILLSVQPLYSEDPDYQKSKNSRWKRKLIVLPETELSE